MSPVALGKETDSVYARLVDYSVRRLPMMGKGSMAILDQGLISGSNFLIGILLARWLAPEQYGAYALTFSIFLLFSLLQQSLILEPQSVLGPADFAENLRGYLGALLWLQTGFASLMVLVLGVSAWIGRDMGWSAGLVGALAGVTIAVPCLLLFWLVRGACYVKVSPQIAVQGSLLYCLLVTSLLFVTYHRGLMSPFVAFLLMGLGALVTSAFLLIRLKPSLRLNKGRMKLSTVSRRHWVYGRWALASAVVTWLPWNVYYSVLSHYYGLEEAGALRAIMNLFLPLGQTLTALSLLLHPIVARKLRGQGRAGVLRQAPKIMCLYAAGAILYWAVVIPFRQPIFRFLYKGHYADVTFLLPWVALASIFWFAAYAPPITLRAVQAPSSVFIVYSAASILTVLIGIPATRAYGLRGAILGASLSSVMALAVGLHLVRTKEHEFVVPDSTSSSSTTLAEMEDGSVALESEFETSRISHCGGFKKS